MTQDDRTTLHTLVFCRTNLVLQHDDGFVGLQVDVHLIEVNSDAEEDQRRSPSVTFHRIVERTSHLLQNTHADPVKICGKESVVKSPRLQRTMQCRSAMKLPSHRSPAYLFNALHDDWPAVDVAEESITAGATTLLYVAAQLGKVHLHRHLQDPTIVDNLH